jgi:hypothetical protein
MSEENKKKMNYTPRMVADASIQGKASARSKNRSQSSGVSSDISGLLCNISAGVSPFSYQNGDVNVRDAIILCQKAYWNVSIFKLTIDIMTEFSNSKIHFKGKNKTAVKFFEDWYSKINGWNLGDQFFRELFRSSNVFLYKAMGDLSGFKGKPLAKIPLRYIVLNPSDIVCEPSASFSDGQYKKILNDFEVQVLKSSKDPKNLALKKSLPQQVQNDISKGVATSIPLNPDELVFAFFKKQDYEPMAVPMYFPVLFDINLKLEFKKAEQLIARACEYMILLITCGDKDIGVDDELVQSIQTLFQTESVGRVFVADYTTKMDFVLPDLQKILGPEKYASVNNDISNGLMNIFFGEQKYADSMLKIKVFLERLKEARKTYLTCFLIPEMDAICETLGFRERPEPVFEEVDLKDEVEYMKLYNRLAELGLLTNDEVFTAYKTHLLPEPYDSIVSQEEFKSKKKKGLYEPIGKKNEPAGRPTGTPQKQKKKKVTPVGSGSVETYSVERLKDIVLASDKLIESVLNKYKSKYNISRASKKHKEVAKNTAFYIIQNEAKANWESVIDDYIQNPIKVGDMNEEVVDLAEKHGIDFLSASLLYHSIEKQKV